LHIVAPEELVARIDAAKGPGQSRGDWIRRAVEQALALGQVDELREDARHALDSLPPEATVRDAAKALEPPMARYLRQPGPDVRNIRSSQQARRDVKPFPKGKP
jgi:hypothetical protein